MDVRTRLRNTQFNTRNKAQQGFEFAGQSLAQKCVSRNVADKAKRTSFFDNTSTFDVTLGSKN